MLPLRLASRAIHYLANQAWDLTYSPMTVSRTSALARRILLLSDPLLVICRVHP
ncbi:hypothetical protein [Vibrio gallaecicus]|uniref:hypothetical protein n=1 Tax=Vibrio gallaecicus TaxID=552386 RepID=UPI0025B36411|nr:hypothetical protein [Vibrio gallaecicus]MDN3615293.1 hypothetical protein [Vibrio gallaecicus]